MGVNISRLCSDMRDCIGWPYKSPGSTAKDASSGIDCSGMWVRAFSLQGKSIYHGSNTIWRSYCLSKGKMSVTKLAPGVAVFKHRNDGKEPEKYRTDGQGNFYHIGMVLTVNPVTIIHSSVGGVQIQSGIQGWTHYGYIKGVDYSESATDDVKKESGDVKLTTGTYLVDTPNNGTVNVRSSPSTSSSIVTRLPEGSEVSVVGSDGEWSKVNIQVVKNYVGYIKSEYLKQGGGDRNG